MEQPSRRRGKAATIALWVASVLLMLGIGLAGLAKFVKPAAWDPLFIKWGYAAWFSKVVGAAEIVGAIGLVVRRVAFFSALLLASVMVGALVTLLTHRGAVPAFGWGATPAVYIVILSIIAAARWKDRVGNSDEPSP